MSRETGEGESREGFPFRSVSRTFRGRHHDQTDLDGRILVVVHLPRYECLRWKVWPMPTYRSAIISKLVAVNAHNFASAGREMGDQLYRSHRFHECTQKEVYRPCYWLWHQMDGSEGDLKKWCLMATSLFFKKIMMRFGQWSTIKQEKRVLDIIESLDDTKVIRTIRIRYWKSPIRILWCSCAPTINLSADALMYLNPLKFGLKGCHGWGCLSLVDVI